MWEEECDIDLKLTTISLVFSGIYRLPLEEALSGYVGREVGNFATKVKLCEERRFNEDSMRMGHSNLPPSGCILRMIVQSVLNS